MAGESSGSLRMRLTGAVMVPLAALVLLFGLVTCWSLHVTFSRSADRILVGSVRTLSVALDADPAILPRIVPLAVHLMQRRARAVVYYSVYHGDRLMAGMAALKPPADYDINDRKIDRHPPATFPQPFRDTPLHRGYVDPEDSRTVIQAAYLHDGLFNGKPARIATEIRLIRGDPHPVVIQLADYMNDRRAYVLGYYLQVVGAGILILLIAVLLFWWAISWGLAPFGVLTAQVEAARRGAPAHFRLRASSNTPREAVPFIQAFNALMARTERATESLRQFTANASHQMRTPLAIIRVHLGVLERYGINSERGKMAFEEIPAAVTALERLLYQLISLARTEEQTIDSAMSFDLAEIATSVTGERIVQIVDDEVEVAFEREGNAPLMAAGHPVLAAELIGNLIDNAIRYNRPGGSVVIRLQHGEGTARFQVEDDGPGIPEAEREKVWERFYRLHNDNMRTGSGLGLPIVRALAERMGASVSLSDGEDGRGLCATVDFRSAA